MKTGHTKINFEYCGKDHLKKLIKNYGDKSIGVLHWDAEETVITKNIENLYEEGCDIVFSELLPCELPNTIFNYEYDFIVQRLVFMPTNKIILKEPPQKNEFTCIIFDSNNSNKLENNILDIIGKSIKVFSINDLDQFKSQVEDIAKYKKAFLKIENPILKNLVSYNLNYLKIKHSIEIKSIKYNLRDYLSRGKYTSHRIGESSLRQHYQSIFCNDKQAIKCIDTTEYNNLSLEKLSTNIFKNKLLFSYDSKYFKETSKISFEDEHSISFFINLIESDFLDYYNLESISENKSFILFLLEYIYRDSVILRQKFYFHKAILFFNNKLPELLLKFCSNQKRTNFFVHILIEVYIFYDLSSSDIKFLSGWLKASESKINNVNKSLLKNLLFIKPSKTITDIFSLLDNESYFRDHNHQLLLKNYSFNTNDIKKLTDLPSFTSNDLQLILQCFLHKKGLNAFLIHCDDVKSSDLSYVREVISNNFAFLVQENSVFLHSLILKTISLNYTVNLYIKLNIVAKIIVAVILTKCNNNSLLRICCKRFLKELHVETDRYTYIFIEYLLEFDANLLHKKSLSFSSKIPISNSEFISKFLILCILKSTGYPIDAPRSFLHRFWYLEHLSTLLCDSQKV